MRRRLFKLCVLVFVLGAVYAGGLFFLRHTLDGMSNAYRSGILLLAHMPVDDFQGRAHMKEELRSIANWMSIYKRYGESVYPFIKPPPLRKKPRPVFTPNLENCTPF